MQGRGGDAPDELVLRFDKALPMGTGTIEIDYDAPFGDDLWGPLSRRGGRALLRLHPVRAHRRAAGLPLLRRAGVEDARTTSASPPRGNDRGSPTRPEASRHDEGEWTVFDFATSRPLPSYLVAFAVGDFDVREAQARGESGVPIRVVATKGKGDRPTLR